MFEPALVDYSPIEILPAFGQSPLDCRYPGFFSSAAGARTVGIFHMQTVVAVQPDGCFFQASFQS